MLFVSNDYDCDNDVDNDDQWWCCLFINWILIKLHTKFIIIQMKQMMSVN